MIKIDFNPARGNKNRTTTSAALLNRNPMLCNLPFPMHNLAAKHKGGISPSAELISQLQKDRRPIPTIIYVELGRTNSKNYKSCSLKKVC